MAGYAPAWRGPPCGLPAEATYMTDTRGYIKRLTRGNYWNYPVINPDLLHKTQTLDMPGTSSHRYLSDMYRRDHDAGDIQAIFEYAKADVDAFDAPWVRAQL